MKGPLVTSTSHTRWYLGFAGGMALATAALFAACGTDGEQPTAPAEDAAAPTASVSDLQSTLNKVLADHVSLGLDATGALVNGNGEEIATAVAALDENSVGLAAAIGSFYGESAEGIFLEGWRKHIDFFVLYTSSAISGDDAGKAEATEGLLAYAQEFADLMHGAAGLPRELVVDHIEAHAAQFIAAIEAQVAGDTAAFEREKAMAVAHMHHLADPLAVAIAEMFPEKFAANPSSDARP